MANIDPSQLHNFVNGEIVDETKLDQNFEVLRVAGNDTNTKVNAISASGAITTAKLADGSVTTAKIADANVTTAKIVDANITTAKLADGSVTGAKILDGTITNAEIATGTITQDKLVVGTLDNRYYTETEIDSQMALKANLASPIFTGTVTLPTTTSIGAVSATELGYVDGVTSSIQTQLDSKAPLNSPALTGTPTAPTAVANTNTTQVATTAYVLGQASSTSPNMDGTAAAGTSYKYAREDHVHPSDSSKENTANKATTMTGNTLSNTLFLTAKAVYDWATGLFAPKDSPTFTGTVTLPSTTSIGAVSSTELSYLDGATSNIQAQINGISTGSGFVAKTGDTMTGTLNLPTNGLVVGTTQLVTSGGNVGIGTTSPTYKLDVNGDIRANSGTAGIVYLGNAQQYILGDDATSSIRLGTAWSERMSINANGNVGIGTSPSAWNYRKAIQIGAGSSIAGSTDSTYPENVEISGNRYLNVSGNDVYIANGYAGLYKQERGVHSWSNASSGTAGSTIAWNERMRIDSSGNVGIGTTSPTQKLTIGSGSIRLLGTSNVDIGTTTDSAYIDSYTSGKSLAFLTQSAERMRINANGEVGIGHTYNGLGKLTAEGHFASVGSSNLTTVSGGTGVSEKVFGFTFDGTANQAFDIRLPNAVFWGSIEVEITSSWAYANAVGSIVKRFSFGTNGSGNLYDNTSNVTSAFGPIVSNFAIGEISWDSTNSVYKIPISHLNSSINPITIRIKAFASYGATNIQNIVLSSQYALTALAQNAVNFSSNVGIGTASPSAKLDVVGTSRITRSGLTDQYIEVNNVSGGNYINSVSPVGNLKSLYLTSDIGDVNVQALGARSVNIATNGSERMRITSGGLVGINTTNPSFTLEVQGTFYSRGTYSSYIADGLFGATASPSVIQTPAGGSKMFFGYLDNGGGSYAPRIGFLHDYANRKNSIGCDTNGDFTINVGSANQERMRIYDNGRTSIGNVPYGAWLGVSDSTVKTTAGISTVFRLSSGGGTGNEFILDFSRSTSGSNAYYSIESYESSVGYRNLSLLPIAGSVLVGYTTSNGAYKLQVNSQIFATSSTIATSDGRYKENVTPLTESLELVKLLNPVSFDWKKHSVHNFDTENTTVGFIAQELEQVFADKPYLNSVVKRNKTIVIDEEGNEVEEEFLGIAEGNLIAILTKAIQELNAKVEQLESKIN